MYVNFSFLGLETSTCWKSQIDLFESSPTQDINFYEMDLRSEPKQSLKLNLLKCNILCVCEYGAIFPQVSNFIVGFY